MSADALTPEEFQAALTPGARLIGLDVGTKTIGVAVSDVNRSVGTALETIRRGKFRDDSVRMAEIIADYSAGGLVIGLPLNMDGSQGPRAQSARAYARNLAAATGLPVLLWDERLSTVAAERALIAADTSRRRRAETIDKVAAAYILQGALDRLANL